VAKAQKARKVIFISSSSVYGVPPTSEALTEDSSFAPFEAYGKSKVAAEDICRAYKGDVDISIIRPRTIVGAGRMGILSLVFGWVGRNRPLMILGGGKNRYQLVSPQDLAEAVYRVSVASCSGEDFNVGTTRFGTLHQDLTEFLQGIGSRSRIHSVPGWFARAVLPILSATRLVPFVKYQYTMADRDVYFSTDKMQRILGWVPTQSNSNMLVEAFTWYQKNPHVQGGSIHSRGLKAGLLRLLG
jgi:nucleoside-diphosphate-sugar epimerase